MKIAVFYHGRLSGGGMHQDNGPRKPGIDPEVGRLQFAQQIQLLVESGLYSAADEVYVGINGGAHDHAYAHSLPYGIRLIHHGADAESLLPTMRFLQDWLPEHPDWLVCFWHMKGVTHPHDPTTQAWRRCLEHHTIRNWNRCVSDLETGKCDAAGAHWMRGVSEGAPVWFFGGVFFWATAKFLLTLPKLPEHNPRTRHEWFSPEHWIGSAHMTGTGLLPRVIDYTHHQISVEGCTNGLTHG